MLIHLHSKTTITLEDFTEKSFNNGLSIDFDLPCINFRDGDNVEVLQLTINWNKPVLMDIIGYISSSLVDKSPANRKQQIISIYHDAKNITSCTPTHLEKYKIQCPALDSSVFKLHLSEKPKNREIEKIYLLLRISNDRI